MDSAGGFGWLDDASNLAAERGVRTWITCRMTHVAALATLCSGAADPDLARCLDQSAAALSPGGILRDDRHGGWDSEVIPRCYEVKDQAKAAYAHAFVILATSSLTPSAIHKVDACWTTL